LTAVKLSVRCVFSCALAGGQLGGGARASADRCSTSFPLFPAGSSEKSFLWIRPLHSARVARRVQTSDGKKYAIEKAAYLQANAAPAAQHASNGAIMTEYWTEIMRKS
jgi:hypothetical protein